jgi:hypothetical protein
VLGATVLSIVLVLAAAPAVSVFCQALCVPIAVPANQCHQETGDRSARIGARHVCQDSSLGAAVLLREDSRRLQLAGTVATVSLFLGVQTKDVRLPAAGAPPPSELKRTPLTILRI